MPCRPTQWRSVGFRPLSNDVPATPIGPTTPSEPYRHAPGLQKKGVSKIKNTTVTTIVIIDLMGEEIIGLDKRRER